MSHLHQTLSIPPALRFLYSNRRVSPSHNPTLFFPRLNSIFSMLEAPRHKLILFHTPPSAPIDVDRGARSVNRDYNDERTSIQPMMRSTNKLDVTESFNGFREANDRLSEYHRRMTEEDLVDALGPLNERNGVVAYVCGPPAMTDWAVDTLETTEGMENRRVFCEKWW